ncbi:DNA-binding protein DDB_G0278111 isoform X1 [Camellia sinensis]|uniref:DNA-binding protein DDB_G0278111 isoform X1 n=1 Tax=Camellia sinensis TaxID=4442 RepID=UPI001036EBB5|nr:DNA-binding protein DDB_G0278111 isoform X1 [Camellia sinensis]
MADPELEAIRQRRMQELMAQHGMGNQQNSEQQNSQEEAKREADERRQMMLSQILSSEARERRLRIVALCGRRENSRVAWSAGSMVLASKRSMSCIEISVARIALVKPEKARAVEDVILRAAQMGQIVEKVSEERLITLLEQINTQTTKQTKVTIQRRRSVLEDDD